MTKSSSLFSLVAVPLLVLAATQYAFTQEDVGYIKTVRGEVYWKMKAEDQGVKLDPNQKGRKLVVGERFKCAKGSSLVLVLRGKEETITEQMGWFVIFGVPPNPAAPASTLKRKIEDKSGGTGGGKASMENREKPKNPLDLPTGERASNSGWERLKNFRGIVIKRNPDSFTMADTMGGSQTVVILRSNTEVKSHKRGVFRGSKEYGASYILRGLRLEVDGTRNSDGSITADKIRFDEQDLRTAQALKATLDPAEAEINEKLKQQQAESERLAGQIEENRALTQQAQAAADAAAESARKAQQTADYANNRINGLDDFDSIKTITVQFATNSATLGPKAKATIDEAAAWVKTQNTKGWVMAVIGYADSTGNTQRNIDLSERRANAVIYYIVNKYKMPLNRLVQPFGYGQLEPVAENKTSEGRAKNRRVEIRLMVNKGIAGTVSN